jgi:tetratricopeptide (TPR) repeat protein
MGCVDEPLLAGTPDIGIFFQRWLAGCSFGEAAYASQRFLSWQTTVIGDPLYRPFDKDPRHLHEYLRRENSKLIEWSHLRVINRGLNLGMKTDKLIDYLLNPAEPQDSAVLKEKLADLYEMEGRDSMAIDALTRALDLNPTPQQKVRITFRLADKLEAEGESRKELALLQNFQEKNPDYPDQRGLTARALDLARRLDHAFQNPLH